MGDQAITAPATTAALDTAFAAFLRLDVANGDASPDTVRGYRAQVAQWVGWCQSRGVEPAAARPDDLKTWRAALVTAGYQPASIAHKLSVVRRFYQAAVTAGLRPDNPAAGLRPPRDKRAPEDVPSLSEGELLLLFRELARGAGEKEFRDRALLALLALHGLRTVEIERANVEDLYSRGDHPVLRVRGKGHDRIVYLRADIAAAIQAYLAVRGVAPTDDAGAPLFVAVGNFAAGHRLSRRGLRKIVDGYLRAATLKRPGISDHALRHTAATLAYHYSRDLRAVQEMLGHADPKTTSKYARIVDRAKNNPALAVPVTI